MPVPTVILNVSASAVPDVVARITAFMLQHQYAFRQTVHPEPHTEIDIFSSSDTQALDIRARVSLQVSASAPSEPFIQWPADITSVPPETATLLQHLLEVCPPSGAT